MANDESIRQLIPERAGALECGASMRRFPTDAERHAKRFEDGPHSKAATPLLVIHVKGETS